MDIKNLFNFRPKVKMRENGEECFAYRTTFWYIFKPARTNNQKSEELQ